MKKNWSLKRIIFTTFLVLLAGALALSLFNCGRTQNQSTPVWQTLAPMPTARAFVSTGVISSEGKHFIFVMGGGNGISNYISVEVYNINENSWSTGIPLPNHVYDSETAVTLNNKIYFFGFAHNPTVPYLYVFDPSNPSWQSIDWPFTEIGNCTITAAENRLIFIGGITSSYPTTDLASVEAYYPDSGTWEVLPPMPTARSGMGVTVNGSDIYVLGGINFLPEVHGLQTVEAYNVLTRTWTTLSSFRYPHLKNVAVGTINNNIYLFGGGDTINGDLDQTETGEVFNTLTNTWTDNPDPIPNFYATTISYGGKIYYFGGLSLSGFINTAQTYTPSIIP